MAGSDERSRRRTPPGPGTPAAAPHDDRPPADLALAFLAFAGSGCLLILEIVASRLLAPTVGVSLYTWTSVIGVVLAGVSLGNFIGGRVADQWPTRSAVAIVYLGGSVASLAILFLVHALRSIQLPGGAPGLVQVLWLTAVLFFVPSTVIAAATPILTRLSLHSLDHGGRAVGRIQAAAALGSITGTFLTGFLLISDFGTRRIVGGVSVMLLLLAVAARPPWLKARVYELGSLFAVIVTAGVTTHSGCLQESSYYCIRVTDVKVGVVSSAGATQQADQFRALYLDRVQHSVSDLTNPKVLFYGYEQLYGIALEQIHKPGSSVDAFFIGGGGYTFPRWLEAVYSGPILVAEIDPAVTSVAHRYLGLDNSPRIQTVHEDARRALESLPASKRFDVVVGDAFSDVEVPFQLTTREFAELVARHLKPDGLYFLNIIDAGRYDFLRSELRTLESTFTYVAVLANPTTPWPPSGGKDVAIVATDVAPGRPLDTVPANEVQAFIAGGHSVLLTDDHAPVDQLLAPAVDLELKHH